VAASGARETYPAPGRCEHFHLFVFFSGLCYLVYTACESQMRILYEFPRSLHTFSLFKSFTCCFHPTSFRRRCTRSKPIATPTPFGSRSRSTASPRRSATATATAAGAAPAKVSATWRVCWRVEKRARPKAPTPRGCSKTALCCGTNWWKKPKNSLKPSRSGA